MDPAAKFARVSWEVLAVGLLTDEKIARYLREGHRGRPRFRLPDTPQGRLVWSG